MPRPSSSTVVVKSVDEAAVRRAVDAYAGHLLAARPDVEEVIVFGSFLKGTFVPGSDVDLLIVLSRADKPIRDRIPELLPGAFPVGLDLFPYTRAELRSRAGSPFLAEILASPWRYCRDPRPEPSIPPL